MTGALIHVVDDDRSVRSALTRLLTRAGFAVAAYATAVEFLVALHEERPACVVLDLGLPDLSGVDVQAAIAKEQDPPPIVFLTGRGDIDTSVRAMKGGAVDFLTKPIRREVLLAAVGTALDRDAQKRARRHELGALRARFARLTERERQVFAAVVRGRLNKQIADELGTSTRTVKAHRARVMAKMEAESFAALVKLSAQLEGTAA